MSISMEITATGISEALAMIPDGPRCHEILQNTLDRGRFVVQRYVMDAMPVLTGASRRNTDTDIGDLVAHVNVTGGAVFAETGVQPHDISPASASLLKFMMQGGANPSARLTGRARRGNESFYVFASLVHHPGQAAQNFLEVGVENSLDDFKAIMSDEMALALGGA